MLTDDFASISEVQVLESMRRWTQETRSKEIKGTTNVLSSQLWASDVSAGVAVAYAAEKSMLKAERWAKFTNVEERARDISKTLGHRKQPRVSPSMPKLCPKGGGSIEVLNDVQAIAPKLLTPDGPIRRLIVQIPPGAGKTCTYLGVMSQFLGNGHTIVIVGDDDIFAVFKEGLRQCPAKVYRKMVEADGKTLAPQETVYLRDINPNMSAFCTVKSVGVKSKLQGSPFVCDDDSLSWLSTKVYFFNFIMAGNWLQAWSDEKKNKKSMYHDVNPYDNKLLLIIDEAHKLGVPSEEKTTAVWKSAAALFPKYIANLGKSGEANPFILAGTATVNTTQNPTLSLCLPRVIKGKTDSRLFIDDDLSNPPRLNLHSYLSPETGFVKMSERITLTSFPPAGVKSEVISLVVKNIKDRFVKYRGFAIEEPPPQKGTASGEDFDHPCPVSSSALREAAYYIYEPVDTAANRKALLDIWAGVVYIVDMSQDYRYYPTTNHPYPSIRSVPLPLQTRTEYLRLLEKPNGLARWTEVSQFADEARLKTLVDGCLSGKAIDLEEVERLAPKWLAVAEDLARDVRLRGRTMIYPGAYFRKDCDDNYYLLLLAFYLQAKLRTFVRRHCAHGVTEHQLVSVEAALGGDVVRSSDAPAIYIIGDSTEGKYQQGEISAHVKKATSAIEAGEVPAAEDFVFLLSTRKLRERQYNLYNDEVCPGPDFIPQQAAGNTIVILGEGGHKALDLKCTSNGLILSTMPGGKFQQTQGRVKRSCAFKKLVEATQLWTVNVRTYLLWTEGCLDGGPVVDQALHSYFGAQYRIIRYLEMIEAMAGIGCSNWEVYSRWRDNFAEFENMPQGGFKCAHDSDPAELRSRNGHQWDFFLCSDEVGETREIRRGVSGDVTVDLVEKSTHNTCVVKNHSAVLEHTETATTKRAKAILEIRGRGSLLGKNLSRRKMQIPGHSDIRSSAQGFDIPGAEDSYDPLNAWRSSHKTQTKFATPWIDEATSIPKAARSLESSELTKVTDAPPTRSRQEKGRVATTRQQVKSLRELVQRDVNIEGARLVHSQVQT